MPDDDWITIADLSQKLKWRTLFARRGFPYFILAMAFDGFLSDMKKLTGWEYRDQLYIYTKGGVVSYVSTRDIDSFKKYLKIDKNKKIKLVIKKLYTKVAEAEKKFNNIEKIISKPVSSAFLVSQLLIFYDYYKRLYALYRFPAMFDVADIKLSPTTGEELLYLREKIGLFFKKTDANIFYLFAKKIAKFLSLDQESVLAMNFEEIISSLKRNKCIVSADQFNRRRSKFVLIFINKKIYFADRNVLNLSNKFLFVDEIKLKDQDRVSLKGTVACAARLVVTGNVYLVFSKKDLEKIPKNSIIVTPMTTVDYVPFLKNINGIVTDEGGITCHASVVSRELNIPCIIGTKIATKVFKTGDKLEMDIKSGIIEKI